MEEKERDEIPKDETPQQEAQRLKESRKEYLGTRRKYLNELPHKLAGRRRRPPDFYSREKGVTAAVWIHDGLPTYRITVSFFSHRMDKYCYKDAFTHTLFESEAVFVQKHLQLCVQWVEEQRKKGLIKPLGYTPEDESGHFKEDLDKLPWD